MTILAVSSIILNIIAFFFISILFVRQNRFLEMEKEQKKLANEFEESMSAYLLQFKEENEEFVKKMRYLHILEKTPDQTPEKNQQSPQHLIIRSAALQAYKQSDANSGLPESETTARSEMDDSVPPQSLELPLREHVLLLSEKGLSPEDIAKQLQVGRTEIELILKFH
ncbi:hypothetical protein J9303_02535 [Bacillaceae bacterium Marseille-Q3522]|nr:hypothetical protein [Bacillaceae bacterium Marseille-Q3522]